MKLPDFIEQSITLDQGGKSCRSMDALYEGMNALMWTQDFAAINSLFILLDPLIVPIDVSIGVLIWTNREKPENLPDKPAFLKLLRERLTAEGEDVEAVLIGLH